MRMRFHANPLTARRGAARRRARSTARGSRRSVGGSQVAGVAHCASTLVARGVTLSYLYGHIYVY